MKWVGHWGAVFGGCSNLAKHCVSRVANPTVMREWLYRSPLQVRRVLSDRVLERTTTGVSARRLSLGAAYDQSSGHEAGGLEAAGAVGAAND